MHPPVSMCRQWQPSLVVLCQNSEKSIIGPNVAPKPAQAKATTLNITLFSFKAITMPIIEIIKALCATGAKTCLSVASF